MFRSRGTVGSEVSRQPTAVLSPLSRSRQGGPRKMFSFENQFPEWEDFPNGLRVLIVDEDDGAAHGTKLLVEECQYEGIVFSNGESASAAIATNIGFYQIALVEAVAANGMGKFDVSKAARHLPVILMSSTDNMSLMMQGITMGAADFLQKPLTADKVRNIWQHVVRKATQEGLRLVKPGNDELKKTLQVPTSPQLPDWLLDKDFLCDQDCFSSLQLSPQPVGAEQERKAAKEQEKALKENVPRQRQQTRSAPGSPAAQNKRQNCMQRSFSERRIDPFQTTYLLHHPLAGKCDVSPTSSPQSASPPVSSPPQSDLTQLTQARMKREAEEADTHLSPVTRALHDDVQLQSLSDSDQEASKSRAEGKVTVKVEVEDCSAGAVIDADREQQEQLERDLAADEDFLVSLDQAMDLALDSFTGEVHNTDLGIDEKLLVEVTGGTEDLFALPPSPQSTGCSPAGDEVAETSVLEGVLKNDDTEGDGEGDVQGGKGGKVASSRKKMKFDWTPELHRRFVQVVEQLGVEKAIPSRILELMGVQCLTRHNIASHLQKYRSHRRQLLAKEAEAATWNRRPIEQKAVSKTRKDGTPWVSHSGPLPIQPRPVPVPIAPLHSSTSHQPPVLPRPYPHPIMPMPPAMAAGPMHVWGHPTMDHTATHMWQQPTMGQPAMWHAGGAMWQPSMAPGTWAPAPGPGWAPAHPPQMMHSVPANGALPADGSGSIHAVGTPAVVPIGPVSGMDCYMADGSMPSYGMVSDEHPDGHRHLEVSPPKEILDAAISEALANPFTPLPIGLKPPSVEGVIEEMQKRGEVDMDTKWC